MRLLLLAPFLILSTAVAQSMRPIVAIGGIMHESNSFNPAKTTLSDYSIQEAGANPEELLDLWARASTDVSGYVQAGRENGLDLRPTLLANAIPKGPLTRPTFDELTSRLIGRLKAIQGLQGVLLALHGAMVVEDIPQGDEEIVRRVRKALGDKIPIIVTHDFHANVSPEIVRLSTVLITYKQNPHLDTLDRGKQAATLMARTLRGEIHPVQTVVKPDMVYNIVFQNTFSAPLLPIVQDSIQLEKNPKILAVSIPGGYQYGDVPYMGPSVVVATDNDPELAKREAERLSKRLWDTREEIVLRLPDAAKAVSDARQATKFPIALFDMGDNVGGGSSADSTFLLKQLVEQKAEGWVVVIADPEAVKAAMKAGIDGTFDMPVGGKTDKMHGDPVRVRGKVRSLHTGNYIETAVRHGGRRYWDLGHSAVIEAEGSTRELQNLLLLTTLRSSPYSLHQLISCGIYPERQRILVVKGVIAPRAAYEPIAAKIISVDTPGSTAVNTSRFEFKNVRSNLYGLR